MFGCVIIMILIVSILLLTSITLAFFYGHCWLSCYLVIGIVLYCVITVLFYLVFYCTVAV